MGNKDFSHLSFEDAYAKLEKIVEQLETSSLPLEESLSLFEEGQKLSAYCQQLLDKAELRVSQLVGGQAVPMEEDEDKAEAKVENEKEEDKPAESPATPDDETPHSDADLTSEKIDNAAQTA
jgi:exodeoxyribonuclease VII small subunit